MALPRRSRWLRMTMQLTPPYGIKLHVLQAREKTPQLSAGFTSRQAEAEASNILRPECNPYRLIFLCTSPFTYTCFKAESCFKNPQ